MKLAVVGKISELLSIEGADRIKQAKVVCGDAGKWSGVVGLDVEVGELVTVFLQDAVLPPHERWAFMEQRKWRVRMMRFKGVPSECLIIKGPSLDANVGTDLTEVLGVKKHEKPVPIALAGEMVGAFPSFLPKTDEPNFQTLDFAALMASGPWYATEKCDGTSCTAWVDEEGLHVASRNWELREFTESGAGNVYWKTARKYGLDRLTAGTALQFEICGPGIQKNPMGLKEIEARAFTVHDFIGHRCALPVQELIRTCDELEIPVARMVGVVNDNRTPQKQPITADTLRLLADFEYPNGQPAEGVVIRAVDQSWSFKVINLDYND